MKEKSIIEIFTLYYLTIYISSIRKGGISTFWVQKVAFKKSMNFSQNLLKLALFCDFSTISK